MACRQGQAAEPTRESMCVTLRRRQDRAGDEGGQWRVLAVRVPLDVRIRRCEGCKVDVMYL